MKLQFLYNKLAIVSEGDFQLFPIRKVNSRHQDFGDINTPSTIFVNVKFTYRFSHAFRIVQIYLNLIKFLQIRKVYIRLYSYRYIQICKEVIKNERK